jgi:hypothetical protein|tara:strand:+ start:398 stop:652 length:255 start_codon:yes stop_codon:yes gene_type:complete
MSEIEYIVKTINSFTKDEHIEILKILINQDNLKYSENTNGTFISMEQLTTETISNLKKYINYVLKKEQDIYNIENKINELKKKL